MTYNPLIKQKNNSSLYISDSVDLTNNLNVSGNVTLGDSSADTINLNGTFRTAGALISTSNITSSNITKITGSTALNKLTASFFSSSKTSEFNFFKIPYKQYKQTFKNSFYEYCQTVFSSSTSRIYTDISTDYNTSINKSYYVKATILAQEQRKINDSYYQQGYFGSTAKINNDVLFVGSEDSISLFMSGTERYERISASNSSLIIQPPNSVNIYIRSKFSRDSLYISGNYLFGSGENNSGSQNYNGSVHIFKSGATGWQYESYISSSALSPVTGANFGKSLDGYLNYLFVGEPYITGSSNAGNVYLYQSSSGGWNIVQTITASNKKAGDQFGDKILYYNNQLFVGAPYANGYSTNTGLVYIFNSGSSGWYESQKISGSNILTSGTYYGEFDSELAVCNDTLIIGARGTTSLPFIRGYVYLYNSSSTGWRETQYITGGTASSQFGRSAYISGNIMFVGATNAIGSNRGATYFYTSGSDGWKLTNLTGTINYLSINHTNDNFGAKIIGAKNSVFIMCPREYIYKNAKDFTVFQGSMYHYVSQSSGNWLLFGPTSSAIFIQEALYKNINNAITISNINSIYEYKDRSEWGVNLVSTGSYIAIDVTGSSDRNIYWHATVEVQEA